MRIVVVLIAAALVVVAASVPRGLAAESARRPARIGFLSPSSMSDPRTRTFVEAFRQGMRELGWVEGRSLTIEYRWADERTERLLDLARELARLNVALIVASTSPAVQAAKQATTTIPIVMSNAGDAVATGFVSNISHPEANVTGLSMMGGELVGKQLQILKDAVPGITRVALLWNPTNASNGPQLLQAEAAARALGFRLQPLEVRAAAEIETAFAAIARERAGAVVALLDSTLVANRSHITELAARYRLPGIYGLTDYARAGGLMAYGPSVPDMHRRAAAYVDKILKGSKPGDLPIEQPTRFEFIVNVTAAKSLGVTIPPSILARADEVIQ